MSFLAKIQLQITAKMWRVILSTTLLMASSMAMANDASLKELPAELRATTNLHQPTAQHFTAGQPTAEQLQAFADHGVAHVIDLRPPEEGEPRNNAADVTRAGMAYYHIPIAGGDDLTREHVEVLDDILNRVGDDQVLMHCASSNRVGALMALRAAWLEHEDTEAAIEKGKAYGLTSLESSVRAALER